MPCEVHGTSDRLDPAIADPPTRQVGFRRAAGDLNVTRQIEPSRAPVAAEVLPEVRELQRSAQRVRGSVERGIAVPGDAQDKAAIITDLLERLGARPDETIEEDYVEL